MRNTITTTPWTKPTHANVHGTEAGYGGFRATIMAGSTVVASQHFATKGPGQKAVDTSYKEMKDWIAGFGVE